MKTTPRLFIGSSSEGKAIADQLQAALQDDCEPTVWDQGVFDLSRSFLDSLLDAASRFDFAVLVLTPDDIAIKRGHAAAAARDNAMFELGLFMGRLGSSRTFFVSCKDAPIALPSDLSGITAAVYRQRADGNLGAALGPAANQIRKAMRRMGPLDPTSRIDETSPEHVSTIRHLASALDGIHNGLFGLATRVTKKKHADRWAQNIVGMLQDVFLPRQTDVYAAWLRPTRSKPKTLQVFLSNGLAKPASHHEFQLGEGLAGKVWESGSEAGVSRLRQHPWWVFRKGCENMSYVCAAVGPSRSSGGILAVGSDAGFMVTDSDVYIVRCFASLLALLIPQRRGH